MQFMILNRHHISVISPEVPHIVISICEPEKEFADIAGVDRNNPNLLKLLQLKFIDDDGQQPIYPKELLFNDEKAKQILNTVEQFKDKVELIICQCDGGISRSSATAAALSVILNGQGTDDWIFSSSEFVPNMLVYRKLLNNYFYKEVERNGE